MINYPSISQSDGGITLSTGVMEAYPKPQVKLRVRVRVCERVQGNRELLSPLNLAGDENLLKALMIAISKLRQRRTINLFEIL